MSESSTGSRPAKPTPQVSGTGVSAFSNGFRQDLTDLEDLYRDLHAHPELAFQETRTAAVLARRLTGLGWQVATGVGRTGVVGVLHNGSGPVVMLRADMDALPVLERTGLPYASVATGTDGHGATVPVMHACGHDLHVACLLGACALLTTDRSAWSGTVVAVFQPGEESGHGARAMIDDGLFDRFPRPDVIFGQHVGPVPAGIIATCPGPVMAATDDLTIRLYGRGGHGGKPETAVDPVVMGAFLVLRLQTVVSRETAATDPIVVTVGALRAGSTAAVIPDTADLSITIRTFSDAVRRRAVAAVERLARAEAAAAGAPREPEITSVYHLPVTTNDPAATARVAQAHRAFFGTARVLTIPPTTVAEDFGLLASAAERPSVYWFFGGIDPATYGAAMADGTVDVDVPHNHAATFAPVVRPTLAIGVQTLVTAAHAWLARSRACDGPPTPRAPGRPPRAPG